MNFRKICCAALAGVVTIYTSQELDVYRLGCGTSRLSSALEYRAIGHINSDTNIAHKHFDHALGNACAPSSISKMSVSSVMKTYEMTLVFLACGSTFFVHAPHAPLSTPYMCVSRLSVHPACGSRLVARKYISILLE